MLQNKTANAIPSACNPCRRNKTANAPAANPYKILPPGVSAAVTGSVITKNAANIMPPTANSATPPPNNKTPAIGSATGRNGRVPFGEASAGVLAKVGTLRLRDHEAGHQDQQHEAQQAPPLQHKILAVLVHVLLDPGEALLDLFKIVVGLVFLLARDSDGPAVQFFDTAAEIHLALYEAYVGGVVEVGVYPHA